MHTKLKIIGCGGHNKVVLDALSLGAHSFEISLCDGNKELLGKEFCGLLIDSTTDNLNEYIGLVHISIGNNQVRKKIAQLINVNALMYSILHPAAVIAKSACIEPGAFIAARSIIGPDSSIGECSIVNHGAVVDHDVKVGAYSHIAPNSTLGGNVTVGNGVLIGAGAVVLPGLSIGDGAIIGAGSVVVRDIKQHSIVKGVPAV